LTGNSANQYGGGAHYGTLYNCVLTGNSAGDGGGADSGTLYNCTLIGNSAYYDGGGSYSDRLYNCIVYYNNALNGSNNYGSTFYYSCTTPLPNGEGNISDEPMFVDLVNDNLRLQPNSPCINAGTNYYIYGNVDLDGRQRIIGRRVDMGAYEFQMPAINLFVIWLQKYGLPTDGSVDNVDSDGDGLNNLQEYQLGTNPINKDTRGHFNLIQRLSNNKIHFNFVGEPNKQYKIETSSNLINWVEFISVSITNADGLISIDETNVAPIRFYRGRLISP
jgi:hypothetical protein